MTPLHEAARAFAQAGIPVFPCVENGKRPATPRGFKDASCDLAQIDAWWTENPNYNLALCPNDAGWCVVDLDGQLGITNWATLETQHGSVPTYTVQTPRGGKHLYYAGALPPSASKLAGKVDTRGIGSYVLAPPSVVDGKPYKVIDDRDTVPLPPWISEAFGAAREHAAAAGVALDSAGNIARARQLLRGYVGSGHVAAEGSGGDTRTFAVACEVMNLGLSPAEAFKQINEIWNPHCLPPWDEQELGVKIENASAYAQNEAGAWAVPPAAEAFGPALDTLARTLPREKRSRFHLEDEDEQEQGTDPKWLIKDLIQEASTVLLLGPSRSYKSFLALDIALAVAAGVETFNVVPQKGPVVYAALEGKTNIKRARRRAWRMGRGIGGKIAEFFVVTAPILAIEDQVQEFGDKIAERCQNAPPRVIVLDTLTKCMAGLNENDARDAGMFTRFCDSLVETFGCSVIAIHHTGKDDSRGARGSSAFFANFDSVLEVKAAQDRKAVEVWVRKHKDAEERETPWTFQGRLIGPSLVFFATTPQEHQQIGQETDEFDPTRIGAALAKLSAYGSEHGITTQVLAAEITPPIESESVEHRAVSLGLISKKLGAMSRAKLRAYCTVKGSGIVWHLPAREMH